MSKECVHVWYKRHSSPPAQEQQIQVAVCVSFTENVPARDGESGKGEEKSNTTNYWAEFKKHSWALDFSYKSCRIMCVLKGDW